MQQGGDNFSERGIQPAYQSRRPTKRARFAPMDYNDSNNAVLRVGTVSDEDEGPGTALAHRFRMPSAPSEPIDLAISPDPQESMVPSRMLWGELQDNPDCDGQHRYRDMPLFPKPIRLSRPERPERLSIPSQAPEPVPVMMPPPPPLQSSSFRPGSWGRSSLMSPASETCQPRSGLYPPDFMQFCRPGTNMESQFEGSRAENAPSYRNLETRRRMQRDGTADWSEHMAGHPDGMSDHCLLPDDLCGSCHLPDLDLDANITRDLTQMLFMGEEEERLQFRAMHEEHEARWASRRRAEPQLSPSFLRRTRNPRLGGGRTNWSPVPAEHAPRPPPAPSTLLHVPLGSSGIASSRIHFGGMGDINAVRQAMYGMTRSVLPPELLLSDRDFTADDYEWLCKLDDTVESRFGAAQEEIQGLPLMVVDASCLACIQRDMPRCSICLEEVDEGAILRALPCGHRLHKFCVDKWLGMKACCPICLQSIK